MGREREKFISIKYRILKLFLSLLIPLTLFLSAIYYINTKECLYSNLKLLQNQTDTSIHHILENSDKWREGLERVVESNPYIESIKVVKNSESIFSYGKQSLDSTSNRIELQNGFFEVSYSSEFVKGILLDNGTLVFFIIFLSISFSITIILGSVDRIVKPLYQLNSTAKTFIKGNWFKVLRIERNDEVGQLTDSFNKMAEHIRKLIRNLKRLNRSYERFVPKEFIGLLQKESVTDVKVGNCHEREMSVLFADIRNFTTLSEGMTPKENFEFVNRYLSSIVPSVHKYDGVIDKYIGDAVMAIFIDVDNSLYCAVDMIKRSREIGIETGIGINSGTLVLGVVGAEGRLDTTVISDSVNLASRTESLTRVYGVSLLITEYTYQQIQNQKDFKIREVDRVVVKGKSKPTTVYEVYSGDSRDQIELKDSTSLLFNGGLQHFRAGDRESAIEIFRAILEINPNDRVSKVYLDRCCLSR
jgi:class 3 adenylate cyclase